MVALGENPNSKSCDSPCHRQFNQKSRRGDSKFAESIRTMKHGVYTVAYDPNKPSSGPLLSFAGDTRGVWQSCHSGIRLLGVLFNLAPWSFLLYSLCILWTSTTSALHLYLFGMILSFVDDSNRSGLLDNMALGLIVLTWTFISLSSVMVTRSISELEGRLKGHLRAYYLPQLVKARFHRRITKFNEFDTEDDFPSSWHFDEATPGWQFVEGLLHKSHTSVTVISQFSVLASGVFQNKIFDAWISLLLFVTQGLVIVMSPVNGVRGAYIFWSDNPLFKRLHALYHMVFSPQYISSLVTDGASSEIEREYEHTSKELGPVRSSAFALAMDIPRPWYWDVASNIVVDLPLVLYALTLPWSLSPSSLITMALLQQASTTIRWSLLELLTDTTSFSQVLSVAHTLYSTLDYRNDARDQGIDYLATTPPWSKGTRVSFRDISLKYPRQLRQSLEGVSFDILPGQLVVIVGMNGSGKSSVLRLLARLINPTSGDILIDDKPIHSFDVKSLRASIAFLGQTQEIYPLTIRENIELGFVGGKSLDKDKAEEAARMAGSYEWIKSLPDGFDTVLNPLNIGGRSMTDYGYHELSETLVKERSRHVQEEISISGGEKQRLVASRTFFRLCNSSIRLVIIDEATSALDPIAEEELISKFYDMRDGRTMIFVTHRLGDLVERADVIFCMKEGKIVEKGPHKDLVERAGEYAQLYNKRRSS